MKCKYCSKEYKEDFISDDICSSKECESKYISEMSCKKILPCGHKCSGVVGEQVCPPCLSKDCPFRNTSTEKCPICFDPIEKYPTIELTCQHLFHYHCIKKYINSKNETDLTFKYNIHCPLCRNLFFAENIPGLEKVIEENKEMHEKIIGMALERLKQEGMENNKQLTDKNSYYYQKPKEFAMDTFSFYMCSKCKNPYYGGKKECNRENNPLPRECICIGCLSETTRGQTNCSIHGKDFILYKCQYCCRNASYVCGGVSHYCNVCYSGPKVVQKCKGDLCEVGGHHPEGGEFAIGCALCRSLGNQ